MRIAEIFRSLQGEGRLTGVDCIFIRTSGCNLRCRYCDTPYASWAPEGIDLCVDEILQRVERLDREEHPVSRMEGGPSRFPADPKGDLRMTAGLGPKIGTVPDPLSTVPAETTDAFVRHVVITGGEPMLFAELVPLCETLRRQGRHITIETAGTLDLPVVCDLMSISPKLSNSTPSPDGDPRWTWRHESVRLAPVVLRRLISDYDYQLKFVVESPEDCDEVEAHLELLPEVDRQRVWLMPQGVDPIDLDEKAQWLAPYCREHGLHLCLRKHIEWFGAERGR